MAIIENRNQAHISADQLGNAIFWDFIQDMITQGWRVLGSGDGDSFENQGQTAGSTGTGLGGGFDLFNVRPPSIADVVLPATVSSLGRVGYWANQSGFPDFFGAAWWRIASPADADHYCEFLFQLRPNGGGPIDENLLIRYCSGDQRFNTGATAWTRPSVNQGVALALGIYQAAENVGVNDQVTNFLPSSNGHVHWFIGDKEMNYDFHFLSSRDGVTGEVFCNFGRFRLTPVDPRSDGSADPDPYLIIQAFESSSGSTNHNLNDGQLFIPDVSALAPEKLEDRTVSSSNPPQMFASFGFDDPAMEAAGVDGHYGVTFLAEAGSNGNPELLAERGVLGANRATARTRVDTNLKVGRASTDPQVQFHFVKGRLKNTLLGTTSRASPIPVVERGPTGSDPFRVAWGEFHLYWGAEEKVEGF